MDDMKALEARISAALDRIGYQTSLREANGSAADLARALQEEQSANAQLEERVRTLKARQDGRIADLEARNAEQAAQLAALDAELQQLRGSNADLTEVCGQLRAAAAAGVADPALINRALMAEIDGLTAQRAAEAAEVGAILSELKPLLQKEA